MEHSRPLEITFINTPGLFYIYHVWRSKEEIINIPLDLTTRFGAWQCNIKLFARDNKVHGRSCCPAELSQVKQQMIKDKIWQVDGIFYQESPGQLYFT